MVQNWGWLCPFGEGGGGSHITQCGRAEAYVCAKFHLDPSNRWATIHQRHRQTDMTGQTGQTVRQRTGSIGRIVLQTVAQKLDVCIVWNAHKIRLAALGYM